MIFSGPDASPTCSAARSPTQRMKASAPDELKSQQRVHPEGAVPDPGVAVVPVALPSDLLGQPGGGRRNQGESKRGQQNQSTQPSW
jgi:hypothetical protein